MEKTDTIKLLLIHDNPDNLATLRATVRDTLPRVHLLAATNDTTGVAVAGIPVAAIEDPDVILLDIAMPGIDS